MILIIAFIFISIGGIVLIPFSGEKWKGILSFVAIFINSLISGYFAINTLSGGHFMFNLPGSYITGLIPLRIDALSGWFILIINLIFITGNFYGYHYLKAYPGQRKNISLHNISLVLLHGSLISITVIQNCLAFLIAWEIMTITAFLSIVFEHEKLSTIRAGINFLIQAHFSIIFLMIGFIWAGHMTGSYDFKAITTYTANLSGEASLVLYACFFIGFAIKAGFVPFHTWLPYAHPAAPAHVSGIMSGVIIKIGIFGILRMLMVIKTDYYTLGFIILTISVISGLYGVMLAILQHNLKKLLAYHSIENIGIIGIGIGIGCIGLGSGNQILMSLGFAGALLHSLNHALFKSLLFYSSGNIYQAAHTLEIEQLGGIIKRMPYTAALFLISAIAICGIPPFNGFISEFLIYSGLYHWLGNATLVSILAIVFSMSALVLIGGLAILCFTKAFGVVFLGAERSILPDSCSEVPWLQLLPLYLITILIVLIGLFPQIILKWMQQPVNLFAGLSGSEVIIPQNMGFEVFQPLSFALWGFVLLVVLIFAIRKFIRKGSNIFACPTWGCGYIAPNAKLQYTAGSFVRTYSKLFQVFLMTNKSEKELKGIFPAEGSFGTHPYDKLEKWLIDKPLKINKTFMGRFLFLNNGRLQFYILYGVLFIISVLAIPLIYNNLLIFIHFLKQL